MVDPRQEAMSQKAAEDVSRLLDRPGLRELVTVAEQADEPASEEPDPLEAESA